jgi:drug/metabolite transporter (DMT)-like permease
MNVNLPTIVGLLVSLSIASERLVEIIKGLIPALNRENPDATREARRKAALQFLAVLSGIITACLAWPAISSIKELQALAHPVWGVLALGLLASGGSGFWNSMLTYVTQMKDIKQTEARDRKADLNRKISAG